MTYKLTKTCDWDSLFNNTTLIALFAFFIIINIFLTKKNKFRQVEKNNQLLNTNESGYPYMFDSNIPKLEAPKKIINTKHIKLIKFLLFVIIIIFILDHFKIIDLNYDVTLDNVKKSFRM